MSSDLLHLHVYAQHSNHQESFIVGNKEALLELRNLIDKALMQGTAASGKFFSSDDEGYEVYVGMVNDEDVFNSLEMPYTEQFGDKNDHSMFLNLKNDPNAPYDVVTIFENTKREEE
ncbi:hypothetical protein ACIQLG_11370 [Terribacillus saccharophilus]|uniref:hypothetical protein n=1 Tax=Terribacillus saccharophilus TaxID=361277 RepID=UPI00382B36B3